MTKGSIIFFPKFENQAIINQIRSKYDPLFQEIAPHISLVFPFDSDLTTEELVAHITESIEGTTAFKTKFKSFSGSAADGFIFLDCVRDNDEIINFHDRLYTGILADELYNETPYFPHITVGQIKDLEKFSSVVKELNEQFKTEEFTCLIDTLYIETIDKNQNSIVEAKLTLG